MDLLSLHAIVFNFDVIEDTMSGQQLCSFAIFKQTTVIWSHLSDFVQCSRGLYFRAWTLYLGFGNAMM